MKLAQNKVFLPVLGVILTILVYSLLARATNNPLVLPDSVAIGSELLGLFTDASYSVQVLETLKRVISGYLLGATVGLAFGIAIGLGGWLREITLPYLNFFRAVAPIAWVIPAALWFGIGTPATIFVSAYAVAFPIAINTVAGLASTPVNRVRMISTTGVGKLKTLFYIQLPSAAPYLLVGARQAIAYAFMSTVGAEMIATSSGLGYLIFDARLLYNTALMFAGIIVLGIIGYFADLGFLALRSTLFKRFVGDLK